MERTQVVTTNKNNEIQLTQDLEKELSTLDESMVPNVIAERIANVAEINKKHEAALKKKEVAQKKVKSAFGEAERIVKEAESLGQLEANTHKIFSHEYSTKGDRIEALEKCVENIGQYGSDTAGLQKSIVEIQNSTLESQEALMDVQKYQMEYMEGTTNAMKFLYGLSAYGIASTESIVTNMELILSGVKKKDLGEMAKQQMYLVMDQLKSQENLHNRMDKTDDSIDDIREELRLQALEDEKRDRRILEGEEKDAEQDNRLAAVDAKDEEQDQKIFNREQKDIEQDKEIALQKKKGEARDKRLAEVEKKDKEQDRRLAKGDEKDEEQDRRLMAGDEKDKEQDRRLRAGDEKDKEQDRRLMAGDEKDKEQDRRLRAGDEKDKEQDHRLTVIDAKDKRQDNIINGLTERVHDADESIEELNKKVLEIKTCLNAKSGKYAMYGAYVCGGLGIILGIIALLF